MEGIKVKNKRYEVEREIEVTMSLLKDHYETYVKRAISIRLLNTS